MKKILTVLILLCAMLATPAAATSNENLPSIDEAKDIISDVDTNDDSKLFEYVKENELPINCDLLKCSKCTGDKYASVLYYKDAESSRGYGSLYIKDGEIVKPSSLKGYDTEDFYKGADGNEASRSGCSGGNCSVGDVKDEETSEEGDVSEKDEDNNNGYSFSWFDDEDEENAEDEEDDEDDDDEYSYTIIRGDNSSTDEEEYLNEDVDDMDAKEKIVCAMSYYDNENMTKSSWEKCLYFFFGDE